VTAVVTRLLRFGGTAVWTADDRFVMEPGPDIYGHVHRDDRRHAWEVTAGKYGEPLAWGWTRTGWGAWRKARAAAFRPGLAKEAAR
jgi:hypothetical protein